MPCHHSFDFPAGGRSTTASLLPTKTLAIGGDTGTDHPSVPATFGVGDVKPFWPVVSLAVCASC